MAIDVEREKHPFDNGYWARYDGKPRPTRPKATREGWDTCHQELGMEAAVKRYGRDRAEEIMERRSRRTAR